MREKRETDLVRMTSIFFWRQCRICLLYTSILELARENAVNTVEALTRPLIEQLYPEYTLVVE